MAKLRTLAGLLAVLPGALAVGPGSARAAPNAATPAAAAAHAGSNTTYTNPILPGFHPDPSCIHVADGDGNSNSPGTFFCVSSSFSAFPGIPIHASRDLQHWSLIGEGTQKKSNQTLPEPSLFCWTAVADTEPKKRPRSKPPEPAAGAGRDEPVNQRHLGADDSVPRRNVLRRDE